LTSADLLHSACEHTWQDVAREVLEVAGSPAPEGTGERRTGT
jgi:hypothetical protein